MGGGKRDCLREEKTNAKVDESCGSDACCERAEILLSGPSWVGGLLRVCRAAGSDQLMGWLGASLG